MKVVQLSGVTRSLRAAAKPPIAGPRPRAGFTTFGHSSFSDAERVEPEARVDAAPLRWPKFERAAGRCPQPSLDNKKLSLNCRLLLNLRY